MFTEKGTSLGDKSSATDWLITDGDAVCLRHNQNYSRDLRHALSFARMLITVKYTNTLHY